MRIVLVMDYRDCIISQISVSLRQSGIKWFDAPGLNTLYCDSADCDYNVLFWLLS